MRLSTIQIRLDLKPYTIQGSHFVSIPRPVLTMYDSIMLNSPFLLSRTLSSVGLVLHGGWSRTSTITQVEHQRFSNYRGFAPQSPRSYMGFSPKIGVLFRGPGNEGRSMRESISGSSHLWKIPHSSYLVSSLFEKWMDAEAILKEWGRNADTSRYLHKAPHNAGSQI